MRTKRGFTLIEVVISLSLVLIISFGTLASFILAGSISAESDAQYVLNNEMRSISRFYLSDDFEEKMDAYLGLQPGGFGTTTINGQLIGNPDGVTELYYTGEFSCQLANTEIVLYIVYMTLNSVENSLKMTAHIKEGNELLTQLDEVKNVI